MAKGRLAVLLSFGVGMVIGYIVGSVIKERQMDDEMDETIKATSDRLAKVYQKKEDELKEERKTFEEEKEHFEEVKHQLYSDLTKEEQIEQCCDPELGIPVDEDKILRYNMLKRQYLRLSFITHEDFEAGVISVDDETEYTFDSHTVKMFNNGEIWDIDTLERVDFDDSHIGNLASGMGTGKVADIRYIRNWDEMIDYQVIYVNEDSTEFLGEMGLMFGDDEDEEDEELKPIPEDDGDEDEEETDE